MIPEIDEAPQGDRAFGAESRLQLLSEYFSGVGSVGPAEAWIHVYKLLLWSDRTTGLAHCYESDKAQPGRPWYERSLAFHSWLSKSLQLSPRDVGADIDWLFRKGTERLAIVVARQNASRLARAALQREPYADQDFPEPGEDPVLEALVRDDFAEIVDELFPPEKFKKLAQRLQAYFGQENKRKNLVGEGFEDVLAELIRRMPGTGGDLAVAARPLLHSLPGFRPPPGREKPRKVDLAVVLPNRRRILVSAKWSIRADREEQFGVDFDTYARLDDAGTDFDFVLVTNEFDAARLAAACDRRTQNASLFASVVHVNPEGPLAAYGTNLRGAAKRLGDLIESGRLMSLENWFASLVRPHGA